MAAATNMKLSEFIIKNKIKFKKGQFMCNCKQKCESIRIKH